MVFFLFFMLFGRCFDIYRDSRIAAHGASILEHSVRTGIIAGRTAYRSEIPPAIGTGFDLRAYFVTAIITKKTGFLFHNYL